MPFLHGPQTWNPPSSLSFPPSRKPPSSKPLPSSKLPLNPSSSFAEPFATASPTTLPPSPISAAFHPIVPNPGTQQLYISSDRPQPRHPRHPAFRPVVPNPGTQQPSQPLRCSCLAGGFAFSLASGFFSDPDSPARLLLPSGFFSNPDSPAPPVRLLL